MISSPKILLVGLLLCVLANVTPQNANGRESRLDQILKRGELRVSGNKNLPPFYVSDPKEGYPGFDAELGKRYADFLGVKYIFIHKPNFEDHAEALASGEVDLSLSGLAATLERSKRVKFSSPYIISSTAALIQKRLLPPPPEGDIVTTVNFRNILDLKYVSGISFGVRAFSGSHEFVQNKFPNSRIYTYGSVAEAWAAVQEGKADCFVADTFYIKGLLLRDPAIVSNFRPLLEQVSEDHLSALLPKGDLVYYRNFEFFLSELSRTGELKALENRYFQSSNWVNTPK
ncbi:ABC transporter substrate-binding protein [Leptospira perolatii]|uniref:ABC transporter substrate-binding protein n=1 Tax=Leptospira perolatii TaxID=2023191 RepID=A0A2M9ZIS9_9LEPT|nr:transporter substrate-binding domain-containing protein [Leptospira perolatii]PJZ68623.1 ABC transporter substrate-binding protein [Leptospira perolatii]PJZ71970.1 ABC transporter substrate-binding protein [Leptospira perolatii]